MLRTLFIHVLQEVKTLENEFDKCISDLLNRFENQTEIQDIKEIFKQSSDMVFGHLANLYLKKKVLEEIGSQFGPELLKQLPQMMNKGESA